MLSRVIAAAALAASMVVVPAHAGDERKTVSVNRGFAGSILVTVLGRSSAYSMVGQCFYAGALTPNNRIQIVFGGHAEAVGPQIPQLTYIRCRVSNQHAQSDSSEFVNGGPMSQTAKTTSPWNASPIIVCIEAFAVFGPTPVHIVTIPQECG